MYHIVLKAGYHLSWFVTFYIIVSGIIYRTVASALNSLAAVACQDLVTGLLGIKLPEDKGALVSS